MYRVLIALLIVLFFGNPYAIAQQSSGGGGGSLKDACEISGGTYTSGENGNWACCWADWGCYGCVDGNCKINCHTDKCRKANGVGKINTGVTRVKGLAPAGMKVPVAPSNPKKVMRPSMPNNNQKY